MVTSSMWFFPSRLHASGELCCSDMLEWFSFCSQKVSSVGVDEQWKVPISVSFSVAAAFV